MKCITNIITGLGFALALTVASTATLGEDDAWKDDLRKQLAVEHNCDLNYLTDARTFDLLGRQVARLAERRPFDAGLHQVTFDASALASGTYLYRLEAGPYTATRRMVLVK